MRYFYVLRVSAFALAVLCAGGAVAAGLGTRWGAWHFRTGFTILTWAVYGGLTAALLGLAALILDRSSRRVVLLALVTIVLGALVSGIPWQMKQQAQHVPPIHDITTDTENPPAFVSILPLRRDARSEEHTSELQSQSNLVCRLLLEKKKKINKSQKLNQLTQRTL